MSVRSPLAITALVLMCCGTTSAWAADDLGPTLSKVKNQKTFTIGHRDASVPLSYLDGQLKPVGFSIELCQLVAEKVKQTLALPDLQIVYNPVTSATRIPLVANGTVDIECGSTANMVARQQQVAFSVTTFAPQFRWIARKDSGIKSTADLKGKAVALTAGSNTNGFVQKLSADRSLGLTVQPGKDHAESFLLVETGRAAAFMEDDILLAGLRANSKMPDDFIFLSDAYPSDPYALMFRKDDATFKKLVDDAIVDAMRSGAFQRLYVKWFETPVPPKGVNLAFPMSDKLKELMQSPSDKALGQ